MDGNWGTFNNGLRKVVEIKRKTVVNLIQQWANEEEKAMCLVKRKAKLVLGPDEFTFRNVQHL